MKQYKEVRTTSIVEDNMQVKTDTITILHTIKKWEDLTTEEKEKEIEKHGESIYDYFQEDLYNDFKWTLEDINNRYKHIYFEDVYIDSNSQGAWIDSIKKFKICDYNIEILGEYLEINDVDFHIRRYIDADYELEINDYYVDADKMKRIEKTKKYQKWIEEIKKEIDAWIEEINDACREIMINEYSYPHNLNDAEDRDYLDNFFADYDFETTEIITNEEENKNE